MEYRTDNRRFVFRKDPVHQSLVRDRAADKDMTDGGSFGSSFDQTESVFLQGGIVIVVHVVERNHGTRVHFLQQPKDKVGSDEAGAAGYQYGFSVQFYGLFHLFVIPL